MTKKKKKERNKRKEKKKQTQEKRNIIKVNLNVCTHSIRLITFTKNTPVSIIFLLSLFFEI